MEAGDLCQYLEWDSDFFGCNIARVTVNRLSQAAMGCVIAWSNAHAIDCLYFLADADDAGTIELAEERQFHLVDVRVTLERRFIPGARGRSPRGIRLCVPGDVPTLRVIAREVHHDTRFYYDSSFPVSRCDALYEIWIEKDCVGGAEAVWVAELEGRPVGYVSCHLCGQAAGQFGLVGVSAEAQGKGIGQKLVCAALEWFAQQDVQRVRVVTQGRNCRAQRLYQKCGFLTHSVQLWYHLWFSR